MAEHDKLTGQGTDGQDPGRISVQELRGVIGDRVVDLGDGWVFDPARRCLRRLDGRFFEVRMFGRGAFEQPGIYEEPDLGDEPSDGTPRIVGHVVIARNPRGLIQVTTGRGLDGNEFVQATMSSRSNPEPVTRPSDSQRTALVQFNPQRIGGGFVRIDLVEDEFPDAEGMTVQELRRTTDGRTLAALGAFGLT